MLGPVPLASFFLPLGNTTGLATIIKNLAKPQSRKEWKYIDIKLLYNFNYKHHDFTSFSTPTPRPPSPKREGGGALFQHSPDYQTTIFSSGTLPSLLCCKTRGWRFIFYLFLTLYDKSEEDVSSAGEQLTSNRIYDGENTIARGQLKKGTLFAF